LDRTKKFVVLPSIIIIVFLIIFNIVGPDDDLFKQEISRDIFLTQTVSVERENIFKIMASPEQYPQVLPQNVLEVNIINQTENVIFAEETITELGVKEKLLVKHEIFPPEKHVIEILDGFANGTKMIITFSKIDSKTTISSDINIKMSGRGVGLIAFMQQWNFDNAYRTVIDAFVEYLK